MRRLLLLVGAIVLLDTIFYAALTPLLPHYADELELSKSAAGVLAAMYGVGVLAGGLPAALVASWLGVKPTVLIGLSGMVVTTVLFGFAEEESTLLTARLLQGAAGACSWTGGLAWLVAEGPPASRGRLIGSAMGAAIAGAMLGPVVGAVASFAGPEGTFTGVAALGLVLAAWAWTTPSLHEPQRQSPRLLFRALGNGRVLVAIWFVTLPALTFAVINVLAPLRLDVLGAGAAAIGATWLVSAGLESAIAPVVGHVSDRHGRLPPLRIGLVATAATLVAIAFLDARWWLLAGTVAFAGLAVGGFWAPAMSLLSDEADRTGLDYAFGFALANFAWAPAQLAGSAGGGALADSTRDEVPYLTLAALCTLTLAALWRSESSW